MCWVRLVASRFTVRVVLLAQSLAGWKTPVIGVSTREKQQMKKERCNQLAHHVHVVCCKRLCQVVRILA